jgi:type VI protein secretion system component VasK
VWPVRLTDAQMAAVMEAAKQLRPRDRSKLSQLIADELRGLADVGDGQVNAAIRSAMIAEAGARLSEIPYQIVSLHLCVRRVRNSKVLRPRFLHIPWLRKRIDLLTLESREDVRHVRRVVGE